jgi:hypothetical protein
MYRTIGLLVPRSNGITNCYPNTAFNFALQRSLSCGNYQTNCNTSARDFPTSPLLRPDRQFGPRMKRPPTPIKELRTTQAISTLDGCDQTDAQALLFIGKEPPVSTEQEAGWAPEPECTPLLLTGIHCLETALADSRLLARRVASCRLMTFLAAFWRTQVPTADISVSNECSTTVLHSSACEAYYATSRQGLSSSIPAGLQQLAWLNLGTRRIIFFFRRLFNDAFSIEEIPPDGRVTDE